MRLFHNPGGRPDWLSLLGLALVLGILVWISTEPSPPWDWMFPGAIWVVPGAILLMAWSSAHLRHGAKRALGSLFSTYCSVRTEAGTVVGSEAERELLRDFDNSESRLSPRADYVVHVQLADGSLKSCQLPRELWSQLKMDDTVLLTWQGIWLQDIRRYPRVGEVADITPEDRPEYGRERSG